MKRLPAFSASLIVPLLLSASAGAATLEDRVRHLEERAASRGGFTDPLAGLEQTGWIDTRGVVDGTGRSSTFEFEGLEWDWEKGGEEEAGFRADLEFTESAAGLEQGFLRVPLPGGLCFVFGKYNADIGYEHIDDVKQYSHSLAFDYGVPSNLTGVRVTRKLGSRVEADLAAANGWDLNTDDNSDKTYGAQLRLRPARKALVKLSYLEGNEGTQNRKRRLLDADIAYSGIEGLKLGAEVLHGTEEDAGSDGLGAEWLATMCVATVELAGRLHDTVRWGLFRDLDGVRITAGTAQERWAFTDALGFSLTEELTGFLEYRYDRSTAPLFVNRAGRPVYFNNNFTLQLTYSW